MEKIDLSLIIPAYNEEKKITKDIEEAYKFFNSSRLNGEVIVSTDGVTDRTNEIVLNLKIKFKNLKLISENSKIGKGAAIKRGVQESNGDFVMFADAGYCVPFEYIKDGLMVLSNGYDVAIASRATPNSKIVKAQPLTRKLGSYLFRLLKASFLGIQEGINDTQCGFKLYKRDIARVLFRNLKTKGFMFDIELLLLAKKKGFKVKEFPVSWSNDIDSKLDIIRGSFVILKDLFKIKIVYKL